MGYSFSWVLTLGARHQLPLIEAAGRADAVGQNESTALRILRAGLSGPVIIGTTRNLSAYLNVFSLGFAMMSLLEWIYLFYKIMGKAWMSSFFFAIASAFIEIDTALRTKSPAACLAQVYERMLDDQGACARFQEDR